MNKCRSHYKSFERYTIWASSSKIVLFQSIRGSLLAGWVIIEVEKKQDKTNENCHHLFRIVISRWTTSYLNLYFKENEPRNTMICRPIFFCDSSFINHAAVRCKKLWCCFICTRYHTLLHGLSLYFFRMISLFNEKLWHTRRIVFVEYTYTAHSIRNDTRTTTPRKIASFECMSVIISLFLAECLSQIEIEIENK